MGGMIQIEIYGNLTAWAAPRLGRGGTAYNPKSKEKEHTRWQIKSLYRDELILGPVHLDFTFYFPIPKSTSYVKRRQMLAHIILPEVKPDTTNLQKFYEDCLKGIVIGDDKNATDTSARKRYSDKPRVLIRVISLNGNTPQKLDAFETKRLVNIDSVFKKKLGENDESC